MMFVVNAAAAVAAPALIILRRVGEARLLFGLVLRDIINSFFIEIILSGFLIGVILFSLWGANWKEVAFWGWFQWWDRGEGGGVGVVR
jgi:hypothetical protein